MYSTSFVTLLVCTHSTSSILISQIFFLSLQNNPISKVCQLTNHLLVSVDLIRLHSFAAAFTSHHHLLHRRSFTSSPSHQQASTMENGSVSPPKCKSAFRPKKALVLGKFSRYEFEKHRNPNLNEKEISESVSAYYPYFNNKTNIFVRILQLESRGSDYKSLLYHHNIHVANRDHIAECLKKRNIETKVVNRFSYTEDLINWADMIITSGGDGTYLMAASKITNSMKPLIGVNSDPTRSVGHLCLPNKYSSDFDRALDLMLNGQFEWQFRQRIRVTLEGKNAFADPTELHDQQLMHPEYRFLEIDQFKKPSPPPTGPTCTPRRVLPFRALNEVFIGESISSRVSYFEMSINSKERFKIKSSGVTICTGTGSTSWSFNINKLTPQCVKDLFRIVNEEALVSQGDRKLNPDDGALVAKVTDRFNNSLIYPPSQPTMAYTIRDPVVFGTNFQNKPRDFAKRIVVRSRMTDAHIVIDGGLSYAFNDGARAIFDIHEEDALRTITLKA